MRVVRVVVTLAIAGGAVLLAVPAAAYGPSVPPHLDHATYYPHTAASTMYSQTPRQSIWGPDGQAVAVWTSEVYRDSNGRGRVDVRWERNDVSAGAVWQWSVAVAAICETADGSYVTRLGDDGSWGFAGGSGEPGTSGTKTTTGGIACPGTEIFQGARIYLIDFYSGRATTWGPPPLGDGWEQRHTYVAMAGDEHQFETPLGFTWCRITFGVDYTADTEAEVFGEIVRAGDIGCYGDYITDPDPFTRFGVVCADAPEVFTDELPYFEPRQVGPWIAHYAGCLFVPKGGWDREGKIAAAQEAGWFGEVQTLASDGLAGTPNGTGCGTAVSDLPGPLGSISTCELGAVWPSNMRNLAGLAVVGMSGVACIFVMLRYMKIGAR